MARKEKIISIKDRDRELTFKLKEMGALKAERWRFKIIMLLLKSGVQLPEGAGIEDGISTLMQGGAETLVKAISSVDEEKAILLFDEMLTCCVTLEISGIGEVLTPDMIDANIEDSATITKLRWELLKLHFDFLADGGKLSSLGHSPIKVMSPKKA